MPSESKPLLTAQTEKPNHYSCPFLHRTAGDTERRYHLRYYKTCMCVHDTDARGYCVKNGMHCAFAHGSHDHRPPVYDIKEIQALEASEADGSSANGPNALDKERNLMNEDPKWQDTNYVLTNYKTEPCKRPPRLCRQGYACPQYHNSKDKRRSPRKFKYRSTPCPNVKHGEEWGEPANCDSGDLCSYCHTRTEQQFHPEIYKSTKCNDVQQAGYCPRGVFCAFAHVELIMSSTKNKYYKYTQENLNNALDAIKSGLPCATAAKKYNVPRTTLIGKIKGIYPENCRSGVSTILNPEEEELLEKWIINMGKLGFPVTKSQLTDSVALLVKNLKRPNNFADGRPGRHWFEGFLRRHPQITERVTQNLSTSRGAVTKPKIEKWFEEIDDFFKSSKINIVDPRRIFNTDESALFLSLREIKYW
ncbi:unkempt family member [Holotrichia oblita]|uniref:Unkempt family member n=1 Tax=Holotrichia oblita TaxID=644536 RepID=A0ACB9SNR3_HOLOL|nr:unkempt family member [Holotrichia oblita]